VERDGQRKKKKKINRPSLSAKAEAGENKLKKMKAKKPAAKPVAAK